MKAGQAVKTLNISRSTLYHYAFARSGLNVDSKDSHQRISRRAD